MTDTTISQMEAIYKKESDYKRQTLWLTAGHELTTRHGLHRDQQESIWQVGGSGASLGHPVSEVANDANPATLPAYSRLAPRLARSPENSVFVTLALLVTGLILGRSVQFWELAVWAAGRYSPAQCGAAL